MKFLFLEPQKLSSDLDQVKTVVFSNDLPPICRFKNGWYCKNCDTLTEHIEKNGYRKCTKCGFEQAYLISTMKPTKEQTAKLIRQQREYNAFIQAIQSYNNQIEIDALESVLQKTKFQHFLSPKSWAEVHNRIFLNYKFEESYMKNKKQLKIERDISDGSRTHELIEKVKQCLEACA